MRRHFITFGGGAYWRLAADRLALQAANTRLFSSITVVTDETIFNMHPEFRKHADFVASNPRGWGYWLWKPFLIREHLKTIPRGDQLVYLDAGFELPRKGNSGFGRLLAKRTDSDILFFDYRSIPIFNSIFWSKQTLQDYVASQYGLNNIWQVPLVSGGSIALTGTTRSHEIVHEWYELSCFNGYEFIDDTSSRVPNKSLFFENRHDQVILSYILFKHGARSSGDALLYDYHAKDFLSNPELVYKPILALRNNNAESQVPELTKSRLIIIANMRRMLQSLGILQEPIGATRAVGLNLMNKYGFTLEEIVDNARC